MSERPIVDPPSGDDGAGKDPELREAAPGPPPDMPDEPDHLTVLDTIRAVKSGQVNPRNVSAEDRRLCVAHLTGEGLSVAEIAQVLRVSVRTIARDRRAIHDENAIQPSSQLAGLYAGRLAAEAEATIARIRRVTRDKDTPPAIKVDGEARCYDILDRFVHRLQSMGFLPTAAHKIQADLTHNAGDLGGLAELKAELQRLETIDSECRVIEALPTEAVAPQHAEDTTTTDGAGTAPAPRPMSRIERERLEEQERKRMIEDKWRNKKPDASSY
jgi:hypothetical protein